MKVTMKNRIYNFLDKAGQVGLIGLALSLIILVILWPLATVWALNTLFGLAIPYSFWTWLAVCVLNVTLSSSSIYKRSK